MKISVNVLLFLSSLVIISACRKDDSTGEPFKQDYVECKINGSYFEDQGEDQCSSLSVYYYHQGTNNVNPGYFTMRGTDCSTKDFETVGFNITVLNPSIQHYNVLSDSIRGYYSPELFTTLDSALSGSIHFSTIKQKEFDEEGKKISNAEVEGTFHFTLARPDGTTIEITEGRFGFFNI